MELSINQSGSAVVIEEITTALLPKNQESAESLAPQEPDALPTK